MKFIGILLTNLILLQSLNIDLESFSKLNVLLEHAQYHQEKYGDSFFEFLSEHYGSNDVLAQKNHKEHKDLPFKHTTHNCTHHITDFNFNNTVFEIKSNIVLESKPNYTYKDSYSFFEKPTVFQPPKHT
ncbi:hypothetical protein [uncultured Polaribacter sp.]|uniref:hypothetical protein n=1 Tax=uncultured Polaribacter sp. TaxID=174711 RepID=UPI0030DD972D|tara:strand:- start:114 stop:500 length:387 start_codon:yes stop_codon:yes gene_type:complete